MGLVGTAPTQAHTHKPMFNYANEHATSPKVGWKYRVPRTTTRGRGDVRRRAGTKITPIWI